MEIESLNTSVRVCGLLLEAIAFRLEAIGVGVEAIAIGAEVIACKDVVLAVGAFGEFLEFLDAVNMNQPESTQFKNLSALSADTH